MHAHTQLICRRDGFYVIELARAGVFLVISNSSRYEGRLQITKTSNVVHAVNRSFHYYFVQIDRRPK